MNDTSPPDSQPASTHRYQSLDLWRGVACLMVVFDHAAVVLHSNMGWQAVAGQELGLSTGDAWARWALVTSATLAMGPAMFFVMSGFCTASSLDSARRKGTKPLAYLGRRLWRIFPPFWAALVGFVALLAVCDWMDLTHWYATAPGMCLTSTREMDLWQWIGNLTLTESLRPFFVGPGEYLHLSVVWTLCYQEQFYLICVLALWLFPRRTQRALVVITGLIVAYRVFLWDIRALHTIHGTFPIYWHEFAAGLAVYWRFHPDLAKSPRLRRGIEAALALQLLACLWNRSPSGAVASGFALVLIAARAFDAPLAASRLGGWLGACGRRSYSLYLTHLGICVVGSSILLELGVTGFWPRALIMVPASIAASLVTAWAFHAMVERRFMGSRAVRPRPESGSTSEPERLGSTIPAGRLRTAAAGA